MPPSLYRLLPELIITIPSNSNSNIKISAITEILLLLHLAILASVVRVILWNEEDSFRMW